MRKTIALTILAAPLALLGACSERTEDKAQETLDRAAADTEANAEVVGEAIQEGAIDAAGAVSEGAANLQADLEAGDDSEPGPAPITGQDITPAEE
jgi:hypothetical protein